MKWLSGECRICTLPAGWRDIFLYGICPFCWRGVTAVRIIELIPVSEEEGDK